MAIVKRIVLSAVLAAMAVWPAVAQITGAGSTLAFPVLSQWAEAYQRSQTDAEYQPVGAALDYEPSGSLAGIMRIRSAAVDFGATDAPLGAAELTQHGLGQFPFVVGGIVVAVNVQGVAPGQMRLSGEAIADIYLGRITRWSDPAIKALNPDLPLPDAVIAVLRRSDGSGTTFNFTAFLSNASADFRTQVGSGLLVTWPGGAAAKGNDGMAEASARTQNSLGYVDFAQASRAGLSYALIRNRANVFVRPGIDSFRAAAESAGFGTSAGFDVSLTNAPSEAAYPIVAVTYAVMARRPNTSANSRAAIEFFRWSFDNGGRAASSLGYVALPRSVVERVKAYWADNF